MQGKAKTKLLIRYVFPLHRQILLDLVPDRSSQFKSDSVSGYHPERVLDYYPYN